MIRVVNYQFKLSEHAVAVNTTSRSDNWSKGLSPFYLGPCDLYNGYKSITMENAWQYSKVFYNHVDQKDDPTEDYFKWAQAGWASPKADRYPAGKGAKPLYCYWNGEKLSYIEARKKVYIPLYREAVKDTGAFKKLKDLYFDCLEKEEILHLVDFDAHSLSPGTFNYYDLWDNDKIKVGHAYVLAMMLEGVL